MKELFANPFDRIHPKQVLVWNLPPGKCKNSFEQFRSRYARASAHKIDMHQIVRGTVRTLRSRGIKVVAFNFPIAESNKNLVSEEFLKRYDEEISQICQKNGADYISIDKTVQPFTNEEFFDTVHLNTKGGYRLSKTLALYMANKLGIKPFPQLIAEADECFNKVPSVTYFR
jgi:hypothetical protein